MLLLLAAGGFFLLKYYRTIPDMPTVFSAAKVETEFINGLPEVFRIPGGNLELAKMESWESFKRSSTMILFNREVPGTRTIVEARVPATYRYHVRLNDPWDIRIASGTCTILAPALQPTLPPAIDTQRMQLVTDEGILAFDGEQEMRRLIESITPTLNENARNPQNIAQIREPARRTVEEFVRNWLLSKDAWGDERIERVVVYFADEGAVPPPEAAPAIEQKPLMPEKRDERKEAVDRETEVFMPNLDDGKE